jgi:hypothetical protein
VWFEVGAASRRTRRPPIALIREACQPDEMPSLPGAVVFTRPRLPVEQSDPARRGIDGETWLESLGAGSLRSPAMPLDATMKPCDSSSNGCIGRP